MSISSKTSLLGQASTVEEETSSSSRKRKFSPSSSSTGIKPNGSCNNNNNNNSHFNITTEKVPCKKVKEHEDNSKMTDTKRPNFSAIGGPNGVNKNVSPLTNNKPGSAKKLVIKNFKGKRQSQ